MSYYSSGGTLDIWCGYTPPYMKARSGTTLQGTKATAQGLCDLTRLRADLVGQIGDVKRRIISLLDRAFPKFASLENGEVARSIIRYGYNITLTEYSFGHGEEWSAEAIQRNHCKPQRGEAIAEWPRLRLVMTLRVGWLYCLLHATPLRVRHDRG